MKVLLAWIALMSAIPLFGWIPGWFIETLPWCKGC